MIVIIRIAGMVKVRAKTEETLTRIRLRRKYSCTILDESKEEINGMVKKVKDLVAYGNINEDTLVKLVKHRGKMQDKTEITEEKAKEIAKKIIEKKSIQETGLKPFFRLHPPRKGIKSKLAYPKGVLGNHKENINRLVERML